MNWMDCVLLLDVSDANIWILHISFSEFHMKGVAGEVMFPILGLDVWEHGT